jgi:hypothetical protein
VLQRRRLSSLEARLIYAVAKVAAGKMSHTIKDSFGADDLFGLGNYGGCRYRGRLAMGPNVMMVMMVTIDVMMMGYTDFVLGRGRR